ncbi:MAG: metallophosphoesterase family protein [Verrucomicrobiota bacterium]|nr:metallophosphoesterase family protein [Verrucomicrobiota bacterium]
MKYAIISDVHGNLEALEAVLEKCEELGVNKYICGGDVVGYGSEPSKCLEIVRALPLVGFVKGNHDQQASEESDLLGFNPQAAMAIEWTRENISDDQKAFLRSLPFTMKPAKKTALVHSTLDSPKSWGYIFEKFAAAASMNYQFTQVCFCGHTHIPLAFEKFGDVKGGKYTEVKLLPGRKYMINVGSVGQPRDGDPRASFATFDMEENLVKLYRQKYDVEKTSKKILEVGLPERLALRIKKGR